jgi:hypothetical protein
VDFPAEFPELPETGDYYCAIEASLALTSSSMGFSFYLDNSEAAG